MSVKQVYERRGEERGGERAEGTAFHSWASKEEGRRRPNGRCCPPSARPSLRGKKSSHIKRAWPQSRLGRSAPIPFPLHNGEGGGGAQVSQSQSDLLFSRAQAVGRRSGWVACSVGVMVSSAGKRLKRAIPWMLEPSPAGATLRKATSEGGRSIRLGRYVWRHKEPKPPSPFLPFRYFGIHGPKPEGERERERETEDDVSLFICNAVDEGRRGGTNCTASIDILLLGPKRKKER